jgi:hypothetical protein
MMRTSALLALVASAAMAAVKALLAEPLWWPFLVVEYVAAAALAFGAIAVLRGGQGRTLTAGWAFTLGITWSTFFHHLAERPGLEQRTPVDFGLGLLLLTAILGAALCIGNAPRPLGAQRATPEKLGATS